VSICKPTVESIRVAAKAIREGGVVVMPTETVYGLACDAMSESAVLSVFAIKGRPAENPLIVHLSSTEELERVVHSVPDIAFQLAERFWPGPFTMVLPKAAEVPDCTTAGLVTVAVRVPNHPVALALIRESGCPIAAPSANMFTRISPTRAEDVDGEIQGRVTMVLDGGPCDVGLESTVLDLSGAEPQILRPGSVTRADIEAVLGKPLGAGALSSVRKSPGLYRRHYAPRAKVVLVERLEVGQPGLTFLEPTGRSQIRMPLDSKAYAVNLYSVLKRLDELGFDEIGIELPPVSSEWEAIHDRLKKASAS